MPDPALFGAATDAGAAGVAIDEDMAIEAETLINKFFNFVKNQVVVAHAVDDANALVGQLSAVVGVVVVVWPELRALPKQTWDWKVAAGNAAVA